MFCLDTNIVIVALNMRRPAIRERLRQEQAARTLMMIPSIVLYELRYGMAKSDRRIETGRLLDEFLADGYVVLPFDADDAAEAGDIRADLETRGLPIGPYDTLIAAQARRRGAVLVTSNRREFDRIPGLSVTDWNE